MEDIRVPKPRQLPSGKWFIQLRIKGASIPITADSSDACKAEAALVKLGLKKPEPKEKDVSLPLGKAIDNYIGERDNLLSPATIRIYKSIRKNHFQELMRCDVANITRGQLQAAVNLEAKTKSPKTVRNAYGLIAATLQDNRTMDLSKIRLPEKNAEARQALSREQLQRLYDEVAGTDIEVPVLLASWLGLRRSEILALSWDAVDSESRTITIKAAMVPGENGMVIKGPKTQKSMRTIQTDQFLIDKILGIEKREHTDLVFKQTATTMTNHLNDACDRAEIPHIGFHALRHTNASVMLALNVPDKYAMERGGWSSGKTMKTIYQHTMDDKRKSVNDAIDQYYRSVFFRLDGDSKEASSENAASDKELHLAVNLIRAIMDQYKINEKMLMKLLTDKQNT